MRITANGKAVIRDEYTETEHTIMPDELDWNCESDDRQMGQENHYTATVSHPELGDLTWNVWEYPVGVQNNSDTDVGSHTLVSDFNISLEHEEEEPWE